MKSYQKLLDGRKTLQNKFALNTLLELGRKNILDNQYYEKMLNDIDKGGSAFMTADYQREILEIAKDMAKLNDKDLCEYIYDKVKDEKKLERGAR